MKSNELALAAAAFLVLNGDVAPAAGLAADTLDRPAETSVAEAARAQAHDMSGHTHGRSSYRQVDADKVPDTQASGHGTPGAAPPPAVEEDPHAGHDMSHEGHP